MTETHPTVTLAGKEWPVGELTWRQLKTCRRALLELTARVNDAVNAAPPVPDETEDDRQARQMAIVMAVFRDLPDEEYDRLVVAPIHAALTVLNPTLTREEVDSWPTTESERQLAWFAARSQSGLFVLTGRRDAAAEPEEDPQPGEDRGA